MRAILGGVLGKVPRPSPAMMVALLALLLAASGAAVAAGGFTASDGTITACRDNKTGVLRVINAQGGQACSAKETTITWKDGITGKVADSDKLDGKDSTDFYAAGSKVGDSDKVDGLDSADFAKAYKRTVLVSPVGTPTENGTTLRNALSGINGATADNPYLLKIEPGNYDMRGANLNMKPYVDVEGSGEGVTTITSSNPNTVVGAAHSEMRSLTAWNFNGIVPRDTSNVVYTDQSPFWLSNVTLKAVATGSLTAGLHVASHPQERGVTLNQVDIESSGSFSDGIQVDDGIVVRVNNSRVSGFRAINAPHGIVRVSASMLRGGGDFGSNSVVGDDVACAGVYDMNYTFYANTCP